MTDIVQTIGEYLVSKNGDLIPSRKTRRNIIIYSLAVFYSFIGLILWFGSPQNSLHSSGLAWSFSASIALVFAYVFGAIIDTRTIVNQKEKV